MHKTSFIVIGAVASAVLSVGAAQAQAARDWYVAAAGTVSEPRDTKGAIANAGAPGFTVRTANSFETGYGVQAAIGRQVGRFRLEGEIGFARDKQDHYVAIAPPTGRIPADVEQDTLRAMVNGYVDLSDGSLQPFIGLCLSGTYSEGELRSMVMGAGGLVAYLGTLALGVRA